MLNKKKVLFLLHLPPPIHGSSMVGEYIYESKIINQDFSAKYINLLASKEVNSSGKISLGKILSFVKIVFKLLAELIHFKPALCYFALTATELAFYRDVIIVGLLKAFGTDIIYHLHNKGVTRFSKSSYIHRLLYRFVFNNTDVILLSSYLYSDIQAFVPEYKVHICPNGIPDFKTYNENHSNNNTDFVKILFLSNLIESKGVFVLLEACSKLKESNIRFSCNFVGGEGDITIEQFKKKVQQLGLVNEVNYLGNKYGQEKEKIFSQNNIFVLPTFYPNECLPLVIIEAMQNKMPVISTFEGGIRDLVNDGVTGFLVPQKNVHSLYEKLELLILNPKLAQSMGEKGRIKFEKEFTLKIFEEKMAEILRFK